MATTLVTESVQQTGQQRWKRRLPSGSPRDTKKYKLCGGGGMSTCRQSATRGASWNEQRSVPLTLARPLESLSIPPTPVDMVSPNQSIVSSDDQSTGLLTPVSHQGAELRGGGPHVVTGDSTENNGFIPSVHAYNEDRVKSNGSGAVLSAVHRKDVGVPPVQPEAIQFRYVWCLVQVTVTLVESIWGLGTHDVPSRDGIAAKARVLPLSLFVQEILRRSRVSCSVLKLALYYLHSARHTIAQHAAAATCAMQPVRCGRRMFLAALILASKYVQDRNYSNRAWAKIAGLSIHEVNANELLLLQILDHRLYVDADVFGRWSERLVKVGAHVQRDH